MNPPALIPFAIVSVFAICFASATFASETEFLRWRKIVLLFEDGNSLEAEAQGAHCKSFKIKAYGEEFSFSPEDLEKIQGLPLSSLNTFSEAGYEETGGSQITLVLNSSYFQGHGEPLKVVRITIQRSGYSIEESKEKIPAGYFPQKPQDPSIPRQPLQWRACGFQSPKHHRLGRQQ